jgi:hypothetical protein
MLALICRTLAHIMGSGAYPPHCWQLFLPSNADPENRHKSLPLPQQSPNTCPAHLCSGTHSCQVTAASALVALALLPDQYKLPDHRQVKYRGPFREILMEMGLLPYLLTLARAPWPSHCERAAARGIASAGFMALAATGLEQPRPHLKDLVEHASERTQAGDMLHDEFQMLVATLWLATRNHCNREYLQATTALVSVVAELLKWGVAHLLCFGTTSAACTPSRGSAHSSESAAAVLAASIDSQFDWLLGVGKASITKGLEMVVLLLWTLLDNAACRHKLPVAPDASCYGWTNSTWWQLPMNLRWACRVHLLPSSSHLVPEFCVQEFEAELTRRANGMTGHCCSAQQSCPKIARTVLTHCSFMSWMLLHMRQDIHTHACYAEKIYRGLTTAVRRR